MTCGVKDCPRPVRRHPPDVLCDQHVAAVRARVEYDQAKSPRTQAVAWGHFVRACAALAAEGLPLPRNAPEGVRERVGRASGGGRP